MPVVDYEFRINGAVQQLGEKLGLGTLEVRYNQPRRLTFVAPTTYPPVALNSLVELKVAGVTRFIGHVLERSPDEKLAKQDRYTAVELVELAQDIQLSTPRIQLGGDIMWGVSRLSNFWANRPSVAIEEFFDAVGDAFGPELVGLGLADEADEAFDLATGGDVTQFTLRDGSFLDLLTAACQNTPGLTWLWRPEEHRFRIANALASPEYQISLASNTVESLRLTHSIEKCYSRVKLVGSWYTLLTVATWPLTAAWDPTLEADWTIFDFTPLDEPGDADDDAMNAVFRKFSFLGATMEPDTESPVEVLVKVYTDGPDVESYRWVSVRVAAIDWANSLVWTQFPCLRGPYRRRWVQRNARRPGASKGPLAATLRYRTWGGVGPPTAEVGPSGSAYSLYGLDRTLVLRDYEQHEVNEDRARQILDSVKDVVVSGNIPVAGAVPDWLWNLNARVSVVATGRSTGLEGMRAVVQGFSHNFAGGEQTDIELSTDRSIYTGRNLGI